MADFDALYYDGRTSARHTVRVMLADGFLRIVGDTLDLAVPLAGTRVVPPISGSRHALMLPDGGQLRTDDAAAVATLFPGVEPRDQWQRRLESHWGIALGALVTIAALATWAVMVGLPLAAKEVAENLPQRVEDELGRQSLAAIDTTFCKPSNLTGTDQERRVRAGFARLARDVPGSSVYLLEFRDCGAIGANAFALPSGIFIVTDDLVKLAENDDQVIAVLAHEVGHAVHRHPTRMAVQAAGVAMLMTALAGDAVGITSLAVVLPTLLLESGYSRDFETEADDYAFARLKKVGIPARRFAEILERLESSHDEGERERARKGKPDRSLDYLSTHPSTARRVERALAADR